MPLFNKQLESRIHDLKLQGFIKNDSVLLPKINEPKQCDIPVVGVNEVAFCDNPIHDFDRCPLIKQTNDCKNCTWYN